MSSLDKPKRFDEELSVCDTPHDPDFEVEWESGKDIKNPRNWSLPYKAYVIFTISWTTLVLVIAATAYTSGIPQMSAEFSVNDPIVPTLGLTTYLLGWLFGSLILAPVSEMYGRRPLYIISTGIFILLILPCALVSNLAGIIVLRFFAALAGSAAIALSPGTITDIADDSQRALAYSVWSLGPFTAPAIGPVIGGFATEYLGWRWVNWIVMIGAGLGFVALWGVEESYAPVLLKRKAKQKRIETDMPGWWCRFENNDSLMTKLATNLRRPFVLALTEPILIFWNIYIGLIYGLLYLCFAAYPTVFEELRGWSVSTTGLSFLGLGVGSLTCIVSEPLIRRVIIQLRIDPQTGKPKPESMVSVVCVAAILLPVGQLWFSWTLAPPVHWIWPILSGVPFGFASTANFIYALNYLAHSYGLFAASVMAGNTVSRCLFGGLLPLAWPSMYNRLGPHWACSLLGFLLVIMAPIPFVFYRYGETIRNKSKTIAHARIEEAKLKGIDG